MPGPHDSARRPTPSRHDELELDELTQQIDTPLADFFQGDDEPTLATIDFEDIERALDW